MTRIYTQDFLTWVTGNNIPATGDFSTTLSVAPVHSKGFIMLDPTNVSSRESVYYHDKIGSTIYVKAENRIAPKYHAMWATYQMTNSSELLNYISKNTNTFGYIEKKWALNITVWWGYIIWADWQQLVNDTDLLLPAQQTNYIYLSMTGQILTSLDFAIANSWTIMATVVTWATSVAEITQQQPAVYLRPWIGTMADTTITWLTPWQILQFNGTEWVNVDPPPEEWIITEW